MERVPWCFNATEFWGDFQCELCFNARGVDYEIYCSCGRHMVFPEGDHPLVCEHRRVRTLYNHLWIQRPSLALIMAYVECPWSNDNFAEVIYDSDCGDCTSGNEVCDHFHARQTFEELVQLAILDEVSEKKLIFDAMMRLHENGDDPCR